MCNVCKTSMWYLESIEKWNITTYYDGGTSKVNSVLKI